MTVSLTNQRAALIDANGIVQNVIVWDETCVAPNGLTPIVIDNTVSVSIGFKHNSNNTFTNPNPPAPPAPAPQPTLAELQAQLAALTSQINALASKPA